MGAVITIGTRGSALALWQAKWVQSELSRKNPSLSVRLEIIKTTGDKILDVPLARVGGKGLFVKEIEEALLAGRIDLAVHSMKDMPGDIPKGLCIGAVPQREDPGDVLVSKSGKRLSELPAGAVVGTSSLRRTAQLCHVRPDLTVIPLRGNLDTRLKKLETENLDAIILAKAGIRRLGLEHRITETIDRELMLPAVGQGALCIEVRREDLVVGPPVAALDDPNTRTVVMGERAFLHRLGGSCQVPVAAFGELGETDFTLSGLVAEVDGSVIIKDTRSGPRKDAERIGVALAETLLARGADRILSKLKISPQENYES